MRNPRIIQSLCLIVAFSFVHRISDAAILPGGQAGDEQSSVGYDALTGEIFIAAPTSTQLTSIRIASTSAIFTGDAAEHLTLPPSGFDVDDDDVIFKSTIGSSFGSLSFGNVSQPGLTEAFILNDLDVTGSLEGGGDLGPVDLIYVVPEPATAAVALCGFLALGLCRARSGSVRNRRFFRGQSALN